MSDDHCERSLAVNIVWNNNNKCLFSALVGASPPPEQHMSKHLNTRESRFTFILKLEEFLSRKTSHASTMSCDQWGRAAAAEWPIRSEHCQWRHLLTRQEIRDLVSWPEPEPGATYTLSHIYTEWGVTSDGYKLVWRSSFLLVKRSPSPRHNVLLLLQFLNTSYNGKCLRYLSRLGLGSFLVFFNV